MYESKLRTSCTVILVNELLFKLQGARSWYRTADQYLDSEAWAAPSLTGIFAEGGEVLDLGVDVLYFFGLAWKVYRNVCS